MPDTASRRDVERHSVIASEKRLCTLFNLCFGCAWSSINHPLRGKTAVIFIQQIYGVTIFKYAIVAHLIRSSFTK